MLTGTGPNLDKAAYLQLLIAETLFQQVVYQRLPEEFLTFDHVLASKVLSVKQKMLYFSFRGALDTSRTLLTIASEFSHLPDAQECYEALADVMAFEKVAKLETLTLRGINEVFGAPFGLLRKVVKS